jgi:hypothetical protein
MREFTSRAAVIAGLSAVLVLTQAPAESRGVELIRLSETNWDATVPEGKEVDCIYGDWVLRNNHVVVVIADAIPSRHANMTVHDVGGAVIDLTVRDAQSDQLSAYYPLGAQYQLTGPIKADGAADSTTKTPSAGAMELRFQGTATDKRSTAEVVYTLADDQAWLKVVTRIKNTGNEPLEAKPVDAIRADGEFTFGQQPDLGLFWAYDPHWRQAYGILLEDRAWRFAPLPPSLKRGDRPELRVEHVDGKAPALAPGGSLEVVRYLFPAANTVDALALAHELRGEKLVKLHLSVRDADGPVGDADVQLKAKAGESVAHGRTDAKGQLSARLPVGNYLANVTALGRGEKNVELETSRGERLEVELLPPGYVVAAITDEQGAETPCKVQFRGRGDTGNPNFGPDSAIHGVRNVCYTPNGKFRTAIAPGEYDVIISHGPEFEAVFSSITVERSKESPLAVQLKRVVDTRGWLSADFHSHSTPSGDNTASQRGRVLNLLAEHLEFAPCTEHNRITVYDAHLKHFGAEKRMLTCPGIELTGRPLPINHQNAFPLAHRPRTQDGGGPTPDADPVVQIERLAMWDGGADKLVQINHPNIPQILGDRDTNGSPDGGFEKMFSFVDVIEVHPLNNIFSKPESLPSGREQGNGIFHWLQLMNLGYRVPGVVNTDAHWNFHGSGFLRNYIKSPTDDPAQASVPKLVHTCEHGNILLTNGPFMEVTARAAQGDDTATVGDDLSAPGGKLSLHVRVQCPKWIEVNRVQIFVNGKPEPKWSYNRRLHTDKFRSGVVVFDETLPLELTSDAHLVVACAGEGQGLGPVMGPDHEKDMPTAVGNPIFVDVDGGGFKPNGDLLGLPLPLEPDLKPSKPHKHKH